MDTFAKKVSLRYGNNQKQGYVEKATMRRSSNQHDGRHFGKHHKIDEYKDKEYLALSCGKLDGYDKEGGKQLWSLTMNGAKVVFDDRTNMITVSIPRVMKRELVRSLLREPYESRFSFRADDYEEWVRVLQDSASANIEQYYSVGNEIGRGNFAVVCNGRDLRKNEEVAIKVMEKDNQSWKKFFVREMDILKCVNHPNVVRTLDIFDTQNKLYIVMEKMSGGKLFDRIIKEKQFTEEACAEVMNDLFRGLTYLHSHNVVHRDIKPDNILCLRNERPYTCKLADFGLSNFIAEKSIKQGDSDLVFSSAVGTPLYVAPELIRRRQYGPPIDVWACGVIMYLMLSGKLPFKATNKEELFRSILHKGVTFPDKYWHDISEEAKNLLRGLLQKDPKKRLPAGSALHHDWFSKSLPSLPLNYKHEEGELSNHNRQADIKTAIRVVVLANRLAHHCEELESRDTDEGSKQSDGSKYSEGSKISDAEVD
ncbi:hypothetical protein NDN08_006042 [Rhodosorus marinus]|uniref:Protein kinase domain-containing protein n=1 Tax=Rhodosorus marinus TaxID=101924 RepID=A0AAV8UNI7_9RHOD|nr:hypothetical protein NDN08_006042 [Rhodosorus marinus]